MAIEITIPRLGWSMEEGVFVKWLKRDGDWVKPGEQLFLLESDKATQEIESLDEGMLRIPSDAPQPGETVRVGQVIGHLLAQEESAAEAGGTRSATNDDLPSAAPANGPAWIAGPAARRLARQLEVPLEGVTGSGRGGRVTSGDVHAEAERRRGGRMAVTPRARRTARELGVGIANIAGTGRDGRVRERDVRAAAGPARVPRSRPIADAGQSADNAAKAVSTRRTIARRLVASHQSTAPVTLTTRVDATNLVNLRAQFKDAAGDGGEIVPSITDFVVKLLAMALEKHPRLNARWENDGVVELADIHVGIAVDSDAGLLVPVLRDVARLGIRDIARRSRDLIDEARAGTCSIDELAGGTITVSNLGMYGIDAFTPLINPPEAAIIGLGTIRREPVYVEQDRVVPRDLMTVSLTFDHRVVDGAPAARFLETLRRMTENPAVWLAR